ncbi:hypothetical protein VNI00_019476 [Paramarasmius palmivorus]|uniref:DUF6535 domain-containing protein n=1 Tax=Paramarasmius palmivorus TaxID=297713 RepID=A0AAW0ALD8_9AGAR
MPTPDKEYKESKQEEDGNREEVGTLKKENKKRGEEQRHKEEEYNKIAEPAYEKLQSEVKKYDDGMVAGWKEDIDTLLVFAGLFSAVVTAFLIESYQWLQEDPEDTTVIILMQIFHQLNASSIPEPESFIPEASSIRINCFWFLSLIFSLTSALFGLLCKQWLREHQRDVPTRTPGEDLALRQLRRDSFEKWGVASFLSALPILLEIALMFFFVGVLDLLWTLHPILFGICFTAILLSVGLYFLTTVLPTITIPRDQKFIQTWLDRELRRPYHDVGRLAHQFICPYKSPQAWAVYKFFTLLPKPLLKIPFLNKFTKTHLRPLWDHMQAQTSSWSALDLRVVRQFDREIPITIFDTFRLQIYELRALQWAVTVFRDTPSMIPHLENVLETLPRSVAISAVLDRWDIAMWEVKERDIGTYLRHPNDFPPMPNAITSDLPLHSWEGIELLFRHRLWDVHVQALQPPGHRFIPDRRLNQLEQEISAGIPALSKTLRFCIPLPLVTALWSHNHSWVRQWSLRLLRHFEEAWKPFPGYDETRHDAERVAFANAVATHICGSGPPSVLLTSKRGQEFMRSIHNEIIIRRLCYQSGFNDWYWKGAIKKVREVGELPDDYFTPLPYWNNFPPPSSQLPQLDPIQYSIGPTHSQLDNPQNEVEERPPSPMGNDTEITERIDIEVLGSLGNITSEIANLADDTLIPNSASQGGSSLRAINESDALPADNEELAASRRTVAGDVNLDQPEEIQVQIVENDAEGLLVPLSAGEDEPAVSTEVIPPDTDPDRPKPLIVDVAQDIPLPSEG